MKLTYLMISLYILYCIRIAAKPCHYFQLNAPFFDEQEGIFSKIKIDQLIPPLWRLAQRYDDGLYTPKRYPVFLKPEWSQNATGIYRADNVEELRQIRQKIYPSHNKYLLQEGATETNEYEIFSIQDPHATHRYAVLTVTQSCNHSEPYPINSIYNANTCYTEITEQFSAAQLEKLWQMVQRIGIFKISRVSMRANSVVALLNGDFHVIEINLFLPMPIHMLDQRYSWDNKSRLARKYMMFLAQLSKPLGKRLPKKAVFIKSMLYNRRGKLSNFLRTQLRERYDAKNKSTAVSMD